MRIGADGASQPQRRGVGAPLGITELAARGLAAIAVRPRSEALAPRAHRGPRWASLLLDGALAFCLVLMLYLLRTLDDMAANQQKGPRTPPNQGFAGIGAHRIQHVLARRA